MEIQTQSMPCADRLDVQSYATGWQGLLSRQALPEVQSLAPTKLDISVVPIKLQTALPKTIGFSFPESPNFVLPAPKPKAESKPPKTRSGLNLRKQIRTAGDGKRVGPNQNVARASLHRKI